jgi:hypothetical protein
MAVFLLAASLPASAEVVEAASLNEAIEKVPCEHFKKNANGTYRCDYGSRQKHVF